ncbi:PREDICTED: uncharacterized protein LOC104597057 isoform X2 [Nelumbo nucifera]|uniref:Uncharacterized protein LOC104597057 isoform X2 n=1 Tax=Nelumbo nucifera TaxID=4432 RepID=A0A1U8A5U1_NELNU|nr:PREDICTED: uncharacterized protein LOC104597057 isoform X2 [Nelumbo nucifera]
MAEDLDDGEFWLPSQFLTDDDILMEKTNYNNGSKGFSSETEAGSFFPFEFPYAFACYGSPSALSSPVESVVGSTETESDEEDYLAGLTTQMAHSMLQDEEKSAAPSFATDNHKTWAMAGSPQSTLCAVGSWSGRSGGSSRGSPNGPSQVSSPPSTPLNGKEDAWDLLSAAAGQVVRMKMNDEMPQNHQARGLLGLPRKPSPVSVPVKNPNVSAGFYSDPALNHQHLQSNQFHQLRQQHLLKQQCPTVWGRPRKIAGTTQQPQNTHQQPQNRARTAPGFGNGRCGRPLGLSSSAWPPLQQQQQQAGSGMRAVFLGTSGTRRESSGTGVFLPRRIGSPADSRKKAACSTVLLPARVVQALKLNFDDIGAHRRFNGVFASPEHDPVITRSNAYLPQPKRSFRSQGTAINHDIRLPQEWTY